MKKRIAPSINKQASSPAPHARIRYNGYIGSIVEATQSNL